MIATLIEIKTLAGKLLHHANRPLIKDLLVFQQVLKSAVERAKGVAP